MGLRPTLPLAALVSAVAIAACGPSSTPAENAQVAGWYVSTTSSLEDSRLLADGDPLRADIPIIVTYVPSGRVAGMDVVNMRLNGQTINDDQDGPPYTMQAAAAPWDPDAGEYTLTAFEMVGDQTMHQNTITITRMTGTAAA
ncbi:MAG: hypothetical protein ACRDZO_21005 [Egibacteraceae bacterium]